MIKDFNFNSLTSEDFIEYSNKWKNSKYGLLKDQLTKKVRSFYINSSFNPYDDHLLLITELFSEIQKWGGSTGQRNKRYWLPADKKIYVQEMMKAAKSPIDFDSKESLRKIINSVKGLGISFATKHLKFASNYVIVFDEKISKGSGIDLNLEGYKYFLDKCNDKKMYLESQGVNLSLQEIEEAYFQYLSSKK